MNHQAIDRPAASRPDAPRGAKKTKKKKHLVRGVSGKALLGGLAARLLDPRHLARAVRLQVTRRAHRHTFDNAQLALYARILPGDFLNFGYHHDPGRRPEDLSLSDVARAQARYAELLLGLAGDPSAPALDVGCGMGGLSRVLRDRGFPTTALTPDRLQAAHVAAALPDVPVVRCEFEELDTAEHRGRYGTVFTSESLQCLKLDRALPRLAEVLRPGGRWVACDFFHARPSDDPSLHGWDEFRGRLPAAGWRVAYERDVTPHVLPTLAYLHMWAVRFGLPAMEFAFLRLRRKQPGVYHLVERVLDGLSGAARANVGLIDPARFAADRRYMPVAAGRVAAGGRSGVRRHTARAEHRVPVGGPWSAEAHPTCHPRSAGRVGSRGARPAGRPFRSPPDPGTVAARVGPQPFAAAARHPTQGEGVVTR